MGEPALQERDLDGRFLPGNRQHKQTRRKRIPATILRDACSDEDLQLLLEMGPGPGKSRR